MTVNTQLFRKVYDQITQHPETHDQSSFENYCGTTRCVAGWAIAFHYGVADTSIYSPGIPWTDGRGAGEDDYLTATACRAADLLGISDEEAIRLFYHADDEEAVEECLRYATRGDEA